MLEGPGGTEGGQADQIQHEDDRALQIDDEDPAGEGGNQEKQRPEEEYLPDDDGEERLQVPIETVRAEAGMVGPGCEGAAELAE